jgi:hypothetical protein
VDFYSNLADADVVRDLLVEAASYLGIHVADANAWIVPAIEPAVGMVPLGIVKPAPRLAVRAGSPRFPGKQMGRPSGVMGLQVQPVVRGSRSQLQQPVLNRAGPTLAAGNYSRAVR